MMDMYNINKALNDNVINTLKKLNLPLCADGKDFVSTTDKDWEQILNIYLKDFTWANRYSLVSQNFLGENCNKDLLNSKGIYVNNDIITSCPYNKITLLGDSKATLTIDNRAWIAIKDDAELNVVVNGHLILYLFDNAKVTIYSNCAQVDIYKYSNNIIIDKSGSGFVIHES